MDTAILFANTVYDSAIVFYSSLFILGTVLGSFLNVVIYRLPLMIKREINASYYSETPDSDAISLGLCLPSSHCPNCQQSLSYWQKIPLLSWLLLRGKCFYCRHKISLRYPAIELTYGCSLLLLTMTFTTPYSLICAAIFIWLLLALTVIDIQTYLLPDCLTLLLLWLGLLINSVAINDALKNSVYGAVAGYSALWLLNYCFRQMMQQDGLGYGDFKLLAALGAWLGWQKLPMLCTIAAFTGLLFVVIRWRYDRKSETLPFGPHLALAGCVLYIGQQENAYWPIG
ncbi:prepilin peptidase [Buttiauxella brennerae]|uniref:prepilin peptidase n=1 Tax=Buttiauxella brennerae TaxID=82988 RepID=UPI00286F9961|nr:A24 family peptidase [Buttiauxella brennerae]